MLSRQITALVVSVAIASTSFAQSSENYCSVIAANEAKQIEVLTEVKREFNKSAKIRSFLNAGFAVGGGLDAIGSASDLITEPSVGNALNALFDLVYTYILAKEAVKENQTGKKRVITIDDLIAQHQAVIVKTQNSQFCSAELYKASMALLLNERVQIQRSVVDTLDKLIVAVKDQKSDAALYFTGAGVVGLAYTVYLFRTNTYFLAVLGVGALSSLAVVGGGGRLILDHFTLKPVLNDLIDAKNQTADQLAKDLSQLNAIGQSSLK